eukprot:6176246-Pleurochrysis_carterae.AAC.1
MGEYLGRERGRQTGRRAESERRGEREDAWRWDEEQIISNKPGDSLCTCGVRGVLRCSRDGVQSSAKPSLKRQRR